MSTGFGALPSVPRWLAWLARLLALATLAGCAASHVPEPGPCEGRPGAWAFQDADSGDGGPWAAVPPFDPGCRGWSAR